MMNLLEMRQIKSIKYRNNDCLLLLVNEVGFNREILEATVLNHSRDIFAYEVYRVNSNNTMNQIKRLVTKDLLIDIHEHLQKWSQLRLIGI